MTPILPTVSVVVPVLNEAAHIEACLTTIGAQTYRAIVEVLVIDGGSDDETRGLASAFLNVKVVDNRARIQAAALNIALSEAMGDIIVRVDGHCRLAKDYVERCVQALESTGAAMVGGAMRPVGEGWFGRGIACALTSRLGAGPAHFHTGGDSGYVDTVYLGVFRRQLAEEVGGYSADMAINEDAEFAIRMRPHGGIWFDAAIHSSYTSRDSLGGLARQFYRYGRGRATTVRRHPWSISPRQVVAPLLVLAMLTPWRTPVVAIYALVVSCRAGLELRHNPRSALGMLVAMPTMHFLWGAGFLRGLCPRRTVLQQTDVEARASALART